MHFNLLGPADEAGATDADTSVKVERAIDLSALTVSAGGAQDVVPLDEDIGAGVTEKALCLRALEDGKGGGEKGGDVGELHCCSVLKLIMRELLFLRPQRLLLYQIMGSPWGHGAPNSTVLVFQVK